MLERWQLGRKAGIVWILSASDKPSTYHAFPLFFRISPRMDLEQISLLLEMNSADGEVTEGQKSSSEFEL